MSINKEKFSPNSPLTPMRISLLKLTSSHASCLIKPFSSFSELDRIKCKVLAWHKRIFNIWTLFQQLSLQPGFSSIDKLAIFFFPPRLYTRSFLCPECLTSLFPTNTFLVTFKNLLQKSSLPSSLFASILALRHTLAKPLYSSWTYLPRIVT